MDLYFRLNILKIFNRDKVSIAATYMRGKALIWINLDL